MEKVSELAESGQYFMAAVALGLAVETSLLTYLLVEFGDENGGELQIPDSVGNVRPDRSREPYRCAQCPYRWPLACARRQFAAKHVAKDVVDKVRNDIKRRLSWQKLVQ
jgi:hypothetical protein